MSVTMIGTIVIVITIKVVVTIIVWTIVVITPVVSVTMIVTKVIVITMLPGCSSVRSRFGGGWGRGRRGSLLVENHLVLRR